MAKILMIVGSLRERSFNRQLADHVEKLVGSRAEVVILDYSDVPFFNQDMEFPPPAAVERVRNEVESSDGLWICSPEYNHNIPGILKNLLDWLSRPVGNRKNPSVLKGKFVTFACAAGRSGAGYVLSSLEDFCGVVGAQALPGVGISLGAEDFKSDILPLTEETKQALETRISGFLENIRE